MIPAFQWLEDAERPGTSGTAEVCAADKEEDTEDSEDDAEFAALAWAKAAGATNENKSTQESAPAVNGEGKQNVLIYLCKEDCIFAFALQRRLRLLTIKAGPRLEPALLLLPGLALG